MKHSRPPVPLRPHYGDQGSFIGRAMTAAMLARSSAKNADPVAAARKRWPDDEVTAALLTRAAVSGASTSVSGWAAELTSTAMISFLGSLAPESAASKLISMGLSLSLPPGAKEGKYPIRSSAPVKMPWVGEGAPIPVRANTLAMVTVGPPKKFGVIIAMTRDLAKRSQAPEIFETLLREEAALSLDAAYFSTDAASSEAHAGLLNGLTPLTSSTGQIAGDMAALASAVGTGGSGQVVFIAGTGRAAAIPLLLPELEATVLPSAAVPETRLIAVDPKALIHLADGSPEIDSSEESVLHYNDSPAHIGTAGTPNVVAAPVASLYQTDAIATRLLADVAFGSRRTGAVAYMDNLEW
jgi:hypothetical protein